MSVDVSITVNGRQVVETVPVTMLLIDFLRLHAGSKGTLAGCNTAQCGCCTVHLNGDAVKSCTMLAAQADGAVVGTVEGLADGERLHPLQQAFHEHHALQCGYCTAGFLMNATDIIEKHKDLDETAIRHLIEGNICRCTGYQPIVDAILAAASSQGRRHV